MELPALLRFLRSYKWVIGGAIVTAAVIAALISPTLKPSYQAEARILVGPPMTANVTDHSQLLGAQAMAQTYAEAATTNEMSERVIDRLGLSDTPEQLLRRVSATTHENSAIVTIEVEDSTRDGAARIANDIAEDLIASSASLQGRDPEIIALVQEQVATLRAQIADIDARIAQLQRIGSPTTAEFDELDVLQDRAITSRQTLSSLLSSLVTTRTSGVSLLDRALPPTQASSPAMLLNVLVAAILGLVLGLAVAAVLRALDDKVRSGEDVQAALAVPLLGAISNIRPADGRNRNHRLVMLTDGTSPAAEAFRAIRTSLEFANRDEKLRTVLVASPHSLDGRSTVAANLALAFAQAGRSTILVDADLRSPSIHLMFGMPNESGLSTYLRSDPGWLPRILRSTEIPNLRILCSGTVEPSPADLLGAPRAGFNLAELSRQADIVVFDSPPLDAVIDGALLAAHVDAAILVLGTGRTRRDAAIAAKDVLLRAGTQRIGVVLNRRDRGGAAPEEPARQRSHRRDERPVVVATEEAQALEPRMPWPARRPEPPPMPGSPAEERH